MLVWDCVSALNEFGNLCSVTLAWVLGHIGNKGKEKAYELARTGSTKSPIGPEPFGGIAKQ